MRLRFMADGAGQVMTVDPQALLRPGQEVVRGGTTPDQVRGTLYEERRESSA